MEEGIRLILVRHGNTFEKGEVCVQVGAKTDLALTEVGRDQARQMGDYLKNQGLQPVSVVAGSLRRQTEAARLIAAAVGVEDRLRVGEKSLTEIDYGAWEGCTPEEITKRWPGEYLAWKEASDWPTHIFPGKREERLAAVNNWVAAIRSDYRAGDTVIGVGSNGSIRFFVSLFERKWDQLIRERRMEELKVRTGNFCELLVRADSLEICRWNVTPDT
jgi:broad specificity phosphatase PhoE